MEPKEMGNFVSESISILGSTMDILQIFLFLVLIVFFITSTRFLLFFCKYLQKNKDRISQLELDMLKLKEKLDK